MEFEICLDTILEEITTCVHNIKTDAVNDFLDLILNARTIYCDGMGKSGLVMNSFAMRLSQMSLPVQIVSGCTTTAIHKEDILIIGSGSGETPSLMQHAKKAENIGTKIVLITTNEQSCIGEISDVCIPIPAQKKFEKEKSSVQPMGTLFEQSLGIFLDSIVLLLMQKGDFTEGQMAANHNNLE